MACQAASSLLATSRSLATSLRSWSSHAVALQCQPNTAFSAQAQARVAEPASTSGRDGGTSNKSSKAASRSGSGPGKAAPGATSPSASSGALSQQAAAAAAATSHLAPSRLAQYVQMVLHRELMLKLRPRDWNLVPRLLSIEASIRAKDTQMERDVAEKWELLLYSLALETLTGRPAAFSAPSNKHLTTRASGVAVHLDARRDPDATYGFLEKLVHVILPNQVGFEGVMPPTLVGPPPGDKRLAALAAKALAADHRPSPLRPYATELQVNNLLQYPDFEQDFALFEPLRSMRVRLVVEGASSADCGVLLSGLSLPVLTGAAAAEALEAAEAEALRRSRA